MFAVNKGYQIKKQLVHPTKDNSKYCLIHMTLESSTPISQKDLDEIKISVSDVLESGYVGQSTSDTSSNKPLCDETLLRTYFKKINVEYPNITHTLRKIDRKINQSDREFIMGSLGKACGRRDYKSRYSLGALLNLDKTLQRILLPSLKELFHVELEERTLKISDCPLCFEREVKSPDCVFITQYIQGFLDSISNIPITSVSQTHCKAMNHSHCAFTIRSSID